MITKILRTITGKIKVTVPEVLNEVTLGQMIELQQRSSINDLEAISILSGLPLIKLQNVTVMADLEVFGNAVLSLTQQVKHLYNSDHIPKTVTFTQGEERKTVNVIKNLAVEPAGAFMAAREIIADEINSHIKTYGEDGWKEIFNPSLTACCQVLAHYFYCRVTGKRYNEYEAEEFCDQIKKLRVTEALPVAKHFFTCYPGLSKPKINCFRRFLQFWKSAPGYNLLKNSSTSIPLIRSPGAM